MWYITSVITKKALLSNARRWGKAKTNYVKVKFFKWANRAGLITYLILQVSLEKELPKIRKNLPPFSLGNFFGSAGITFEVSLPLFNSSLNQNTVFGKQKWNRHKSNCKRTIYCGTCSNFKPIVNHTHLKANFFLFTIIWLGPA